jgi:aldose 1-epimerase
VPDKNGKLTDVVVGFASLQDYIKSTEPYFSATINRRLLQIPGIIY